MNISQFKHMESPKTRQSYSSHERTTHAFRNGKIVPYPRKFVGLVLVEGKEGEESEVRRCYQFDEEASKDKIYNNEGDNDRCSKSVATWKKSKERSRKATRKATRKAARRALQLMIDAINEESEEDEEEEQSEESEELEEIERMMDESRWFENNESLGFI